MAAFNLTAQLNIVGPNNLKPVIANIRKQLSTAGGSISIKIDPKVASSAIGLNKSLQDLNMSLKGIAASSSSAAAAMGQFASAMNSVNIKSVPRDMAAVTQQSQRLQAQQAKTAATVMQSADSMVEFGKQSALAIRRFAAFTLVTGIIFKFTNALGQASNEFMKFNRQLVQLSQVTGTSLQGLSGLEQTITGLATSLGVSSSSLIDVSSTLAQAGLSARETEQALKALALSTLAPSFGDLNQTVEGSIALMRQFSISTAQLEASLGSINSVAAKFAVEADDIIVAIQRTGGVFAAASKGVAEGSEALNQFIALFTSVRATTRESAETIATGLRTIFTRIQRSETIDLLKRYGIELTDLEGKFVGPYEAVKRLSMGLAGLDTRDVRFSAIIEELGGFRQVGKVIPLLQQFSTAEKALGVAQRGQTSLTGDAAKAQQALAIQMAKVQEEFVALVRSIGSSQQFQTMVKVALDLSSALISIADASKHALPAIAGLLAVKGTIGAFRFASGFASGMRRGGGARGLGERMSGAPRGYAQGGQVPVALEPGEMVFVGKTAQKAGYGNLRRLNRAGDRPNPMASLNRSGGGGVFMVPGSGRGDTFRTSLPEGSFVIKRRSVRAIGADNIAQMAANGGTINAVRQSFSRGSSTGLKQKILSYNSKEDTVRAHAIGKSYSGRQLKQQYQKSASSLGIKISKNLSKILDGDNLTLKPNFTIGLPQSFNEALKTGGKGIIPLEEFIKALDSPYLMAGGQRKGKEVKYSSRLARQSIRGIPKDIVEQIRTAFKQEATSRAQIIDGQPYITSDRDIDNFGQIAKSIMKKHGLWKPRPAELMSRTKGSTGSSQSREFIPTPILDDLDQQGIFARFALGGTVKRLSGGSDKPLANMRRADLIDEAKKLGVSYGSITSWQDLGNRGDIGAQARAKLIAKLEEARILRKTAQAETSAKAKRTNVAVIGAMAPAGVRGSSSEVIIPGAKDRKTGRRIKDTPATLHIGALEGKTAARVTAIIRNQTAKITEQVMKVIAQEAGIALPRDARSRLKKRPMHSGIAGGLLEQAVLSLMGIDKPMGSIDLGASGLSRELANVFGIPDAAGVPTDITYGGEGGRTLAEAAKRKAVGRSRDSKGQRKSSQIGRGIAALRGAQGKALGGLIQRFASGGKLSRSTYKLVPQEKGIGPAPAVSARSTSSSDFYGLLNDSGLPKWEHNQILDFLRTNKYSASEAKQYIEKRKRERNSKLAARTDLTQLTESLKVQASQTSARQRELAQSLLHRYNGGEIPFQPEQFFARGSKGPLVRKMGILDSDQLRNSERARKAMRELGFHNPDKDTYDVDGYKKLLSQTAISKRSEGALKKLVTIAGSPGAGKSSFAEGNARTAISDNARLRKTERSFIETPEDFAGLSEVRDTTASMTLEKLEMAKKSDRVVALSSSTKEELQILKQQLKHRTATGEKQYGRTHTIAAQDSGELEAMLSMGIDQKKLITLGLMPGFKKRRKGANELPYVTTEDVDMFRGAYAPMTAKGHIEGLIDNAKQKKLIIVGSNEGYNPKDPHSLRTAGYDQKLRMKIAGASVPDAYVSGAGKGFTLPEIYEVQKENGRRHFVRPGKGSRAFVGDEGKDLGAYEKAGLKTVTVPRPEGSESGTATRARIASGDFSGLHPDATGIVRSAATGIKNRESITPRLYANAEKRALAKIAAIDKQLAQYPSRLSAAYKKENPDIAEIVENLRYQKTKIKSSISMSHHKSLSRLAKRYPEIYGYGSDSQQTMDQMIASGVVKKSKVLQRAAQGGEIPIMAQEGEFVINKHAAGQIGHSNLRKLNRGGKVAIDTLNQLPKYHTGGSIQKFANGTKRPITSVAKPIQSLYPSNQAEAVLSRTRKIPINKGGVTHILTDKEAYEKTSRVKALKKQIRELEDEMSTLQSHDKKPGFFGKLLGKPTTNIYQQDIWERQDVHRRLNKELDSIIGTYGPQLGHFAIGGQIQTKPITPTTAAKPEKQFGKIGLRSSGKEITAFYFKNNVREGFVTAHEIEKGIWNIGLSKATKGYGPRLYDAVMEAVTARGGVLTAHRGKVSGHAKKVWDTYANERSKPDSKYGPQVTKVPLDSKHHTISQDPNDSLNQGYQQQPNIIKGPDVVDMNDSKYDKFLQHMQFEFLRSSGGEIPIMAQQGEFLINRHAAGQIGHSNLRKLNRGGRVAIQTLEKLPKYHTGGTVQKLASGGKATITPLSDDPGMSNVRTGRGVDLGTYNNTSAGFKNIQPFIDSFAQVIDRATKSFGTLQPDVVQKAFVRYAQELNKGVSSSEALRNAENNIASQLEDSITSTKVKVPSGPAEITSSLDPKIKKNSVKIRSAGGVDIGHMTATSPAALDKSLQDLKPHLDKFSWMIDKTTAEFGTLDSKTVNSAYKTYIRAILGGASSLEALSQATDTVKQSSTTQQMRRDDIKSNRQRSQSVLGSIMSPISGLERYGRSRVALGQEKLDSLTYSKQSSKVLSGGSGNFGGALSTQVLENFTKGIGNAALSVARFASTLGKGNILANTMQLMKSGFGNIVGSTGSLIGKLVGLQRTVVATDGKLKGMTKGQAKQALQEGKITKAEYKEAFGMGSKSKAVYHSSKDQPPATNAKFEQQIKTERAKAKKQALIDAGFGRKTDTYIKDGKTYVSRDKSGQAITTSVGAQVQKMAEAKEMAGANPASYGPSGSNQILAARRSAADARQKMQTIVHGPGSGGGSPPRGPKTPTARGRASAPAAPQVSEAGGRQSGGGMGGMGMYMGEMALSMAGSAVAEQYAKSLGGEKTLAGRQASNTLGSMVTGASTGMMLGSMVGSVVPGVGTVIGGAAGAALGAGAGALYSMTNRKEIKAQFDSEQRQDQMRRESEKFGTQIGAMGNKGLSVDSRERARGEAKQSFMRMAAISATEQEEGLRSTSAFSNTPRLTAQERADAAQEAKDKGETLVEAEMQHTGKSLKEIRASMDPGQWSAFENTLADADLAFQEQKGKLTKGSAAYEKERQAAVERGMAGLKYKDEMIQAAKENAKLTKSMQKITTSFEKMANALDAAAARANKVMENAKLGIEAVDNPMAAVQEGQISKSADILSNPNAYSIQEVEQAARQNSSMAGTSSEAMIQAAILPRTLEQSFGAAMVEARSSGKNDDETRSSVKAAVSNTVKAAFGENIGAEMQKKIDDFLSSKEASGELQNIDFNDLLKEIPGLADKMASSTKVMEALKSQAQAATIALGMMGDAATKGAAKDQESRNINADTFSTIASSTLAFRRGTGEKISWQADAGVRNQARAIRLGTTADVAASPKAMLNRYNQLKTATDQASKNQQAVAEANNPNMLGADKGAIAANMQAANATAQFAQATKQARDEIMALPNDIKENISGIMQELQDVMQERAAKLGAAGGFMEKILTSTPQGLKKMGNTFNNLNQTLSGRGVSFEQSYSANTAYNQVRRQGGNHNQAQRAAQEAYAQETSDTLSMAKELAPLLGAVDPDAQSKMMGSVYESMFAARGMDTSKMMVGDKSMKDYIDMMKKGAKEDPKVKALQDALAGQQAALKEAAATANTVLMNEKEEIIVKTGKAVEDAMKAGAEAVRIAMEEAMKTGITPPGEVEKKARESQVDVNNKEIENAKKVLESDTATKEEKDKARVVKMEKEQENAVLTGSKTAEEAVVKHSQETKEQFNERKQKLLDKEKQIADEKAKVPPTARDPKTNAQADQAAAPAPTTNAQQTGVTPPQGATGGQQGVVAGEQVVYAQTNPNSPRYGMSVPPTGTQTPVAAPLQMGGVDPQMVMQAFPELQQKMASSQKVMDALKTGDPVQIQQAIQEATTVGITAGDAKTAGEATAASIPSPQVNTTNTPPTTEPMTHEQLADARFGKMSEDMRADSLSVEETELEKLQNNIDSTTGQQYGSSPEDQEARKEGIRSQKYKISLLKTGDKNQAARAMFDLGENDQLSEAQQVMADNAYKDSTATFANRHQVKISGEDDVKTDYGPGITYATGDDVLSGMTDTQKKDALQKSEEAKYSDKDENGQYYRGVATKGKTFAVGTLPDFLPGMEQKRQDRQKHERFKGDLLGGMSKDEAMKKHFGSYVNYKDPNDFTKKMSKQQRKEAEAAYAKVTGELAQTYGVATVDKPAEEPFVPGVSSEQPMPDTAAVAASVPSPEVSSTEGTAPRVPPWQAIIEASEASMSQEDIDDYNMLNPNNPITRQAQTTAAADTKPVVDASSPNVIRTGIPGLVSKPDDFTTGNAPTPAQQAQVMSGAAQSYNNLVAEQNMSAAQGEAATLAVGINGAPAPVATMPTEAMPKPTTVPESRKLLSKKNTLGGVVSHYKKAAEENPDADSGKTDKDGKALTNKQLYENKKAEYDELQKQYDATPEGQARKQASALKKENDRRLELTGRSDLTDEEKTELQTLKEKDFARNPEKKARFEAQKKQQERRSLGDKMGSYRTAAETDAEGDSGETDETGKSLTNKELYEKKKGRYEELKAEHLAQKEAERAGSTTPTTATQGAATATANGVANAQSAETSSKRPGPMGLQNIHQEAYQRGMSLKEVQYERQQSYLSRLNPEARAREEKSLGNRLLQPSERQIQEAQSQRAAAMAGQPEQPGTAPAAGQSPATTVPQQSTAGQVLPPQAPQSTIGTASYTPPTSSGSPVSAPRPVQQGGAQQNQGAGVLNTSGLEAFAGKLDTLLTKLGEVNIPTEIRLTSENLGVNVTLNGGEVMANLPDQLKQSILRDVAESIRNYDRNMSGEVAGKPGIIPGKS